MPRDPRAWLGCGEYVAASAYGGCECVAGELARCVTVMAFEEKSGVSRHGCCAGCYLIDSDSSFAQMRLAAPIDPHLLRAAL